VEDSDDEDEETNGAAADLGAFGNDGVTAPAGDFFGNAKQFAAGKENNENKSKMFGGESLRCDIIIFILECLAN